jgi:hypothetical protein
MAREMFLMVARMEWERYRDGWETAKASAIERGISVARVPLGYVPAGAGRRLVLDPEWAPTVRELFRLRAAGVSRRKCAEFLSDRRGRLVAPQTVQHMLQNRAYVGELRYNGDVSPHRHEAIVSDEIFEAVQVNEQPKTGLKRSGTKSLLAGIARCGTCGRKLSRKAHGSGKGTPSVYRCPVSTGTPTELVGRCPAPVSVVEAALDIYVIEAVRGAAREAGLEDRTLETRSVDDEISAARAELAAAVEARDSWAVVSAGAGVPMETVRLGLEARQEAVERAQEAVRELEAINESAAARTTLRELWPTLTVAERRQLIGSVVERVRVDRAEKRTVPIESRVRIIWR